MGKFVAKKKIKLNAKLICIIAIGLISLIVTFNVLLKSSIENIVGSSLETSLLNTALGKNDFTLSIINPKDLLSMSLNCLFKREAYEEIKTVKNHTNSNNPQIYIYNTHEAESYSSSLIESYNIKYTVKIASYLLSDYLKDLEIDSYVETSNIQEFNSTTDSFESSYDASRIFFERRLQEYPNMKLMIDIHRDSASKEETTATIDDKDYAKILFVVGASHKNYSANLEVAEKLNSYLDKNLTRGIIEKTKDDGNGIYNQDLSPQAVLIEIGGQDNTIEEIDNTLKVLSEAIFKYLSEE